MMVLVYNDGGGRHQLSKHFNKEFNAFSDFEIKLSSFPGKVEVFESTELLNADNVEAMMHIAGVCLNDASANATKEELQHYLNDPNNKIYYEGMYHMSMTQNIVIIGTCDDY